MASQIIISIDFGTTFSGVSWAINAGRKDVNLIDTWENPREPNGTQQKVPTAITYSPGGSVASWGYNAVSDENAFRWFKILLDQNNKHLGEAKPREASQRLKHVQKTAEQVASDYLRQLWTKTKDHIAGIKGAAWQTSYEVKIVLTIPAIWSAQAKASTIRAANAAGIPEPINTVAEPEAAACAVVTDRQSENDSLETGDCFVVCDAGGGTVDLISYKVTRKEPLQIEECATGDGDLCGSVFINEGFEKYLRMKIGSAAYDNLRARDKARMWEQFEVVKKNFEGIANKEFRVELRGIEKLGLSAPAFVDDEVVLSCQLLKTLFDYVVDKIVQLVDAQITTARANGGIVKKILLVGGFGASKYIFNRLADDNRSRQITVLYAQRSWSAVCRGATVWGLENSQRANQSTIGARLARFNYGICVEVPYDPSIHLYQDHKRHPEGRAVAENQMKWLVEKGQRLQANAEFAYTIEVPIRNVRLWNILGSRSFQQQLWINGSNTAPTRRTSDVRVFCTLDFVVENLTTWWEPGYRDENDTKWRNAPFTLLVVLRSTGLDFRVNYRDEMMAITTASYPDNP